MLTSISDLLVVVMKKIQQVRMLNFMQPRTGVRNDVLVSLQLKKRGNYA
ncbi:hypothetical protein [Escherichia coli]|nr:hypothetical protein [Escherichia coli]MCW3365099.1 hypothetical protein [Escherichia coli]